MLRNDNIHPLAYSVIGQLFEVTTGTVAKQAKKLGGCLFNSDCHAGRGWSPILNPSQLTTFKTPIITADNQHCPWTQS
jgi:hypothetical protein